MLVSSYTTHPSGSIPPINLAQVCFGTIIWFALGYALMYGSAADGTPDGIIGGDSGYFGSGMINYDPAEVGMGYIGPNHLVTCQDWFFPMFILTPS